MCVRADDAALICGRGNRSKDEFFFGVRNFRFDLMIWSEHKNIEWVALAV